MANFYDIAGYRLPTVREDLGIYGKRQLQNEIIKGILAERFMGIYDGETLIENENNWAVGHFPVDMVPVELDNIRPAGSFCYLVTLKDDTAQEISMWKAYKNDWRPKRA